jgi:xylulokinase
MLYAGFDCSTQSFTAVVIDVAGSKREVVFRDSIAFDTDLPQFGTEHGIGFTAPGGVVHSFPLMWATALELMLGRLADAIDLSRLRAISGSAQQHGSVYCGDSPHLLSRATAPIWMDSSTGRECEEITKALGGPAAVARLTGSRAFPRFTGPQIRKFAHEDPDSYARTRHIHLVSSYLASLLMDEHAPIDHADGSGMNLMNIRTREWADAALEATAPDLRRKLPALVPSSQVIGTLARSWQTRFNLPSSTRIVAWSGDNPCTLIGTGVVREGQLSISLGTSDTIFGPMREARMSDDGTGHVFASPTGEYMGITVFRNGSLARERIRDRFGLDWNGFSSALAATEAGNDGAMMLPWFEPEITPAVEEPRFAQHGLDGACHERHVRALIEAQMMAMSEHSRWMGVRPTAIYATGGAAANHQILQVMADVFDADVYEFESTDSAALGAALRAWQADARVSWTEVVRDFCKPLEPAISADPARVTTYRALQRRYMAFERSVLAGDTLGGPYEHR